MIEEIIVTIENADPRTSPLWPEFVRFMQATYGRYPFLPDDGEELDDPVGKSKNADYWKCFSAGAMAEAEARESDPILE